jgi:hypothetical protein
MNLLDENISESQRRLLQGWRIRVRQTCKLQHSLSRRRPYEAASFIRRFLHHAALNTRAKRLGRVLLVTHGGIRLWQLNAAKEEALTWQDKTNSR